MYSGFAEARGGQERQRQIEGTICSLKWKKQQG